LSSRSITDADRDRGRKLVRLDPLELKHVVGVDPVGRHIETEAICIAHALLAQALLHLVEEIVVGIPGFSGQEHSAPGTVVAP